MSDGPYACSKLIASTCKAGVKVLNMTEFEDVILRNGKVGGIGVNWTPVGFLPRHITCVDPIGLEASVVIDASGHDAILVRKLEERGLTNTKGFGGMWLERAEDLIVEFTGEVFSWINSRGNGRSYNLPFENITGIKPTFYPCPLKGKEALATRFAEIRLSS